MGIPKVIRDSLEFISDTAKPLGDIAGGIPEQLIHGGQQKTPQQQQQLEKKADELKVKDEEELKKARKKIEQLKRMQVTYEAPKRQKEMSVGEQRDKDMIEEGKKDAKNQLQPLLEPQSKQERGLLGKRRQKVKGMEGMVKDTKVG